MAEPIQIPTGLTTHGLVGRRYLARIIDSMLLAMFLALVVWIERGLAPANMRNTGGLMIELVLYLVLWIGYGILLESSAWATLGKRWMGLRVYDLRAGRVDPLRAAGRNLAKDGPFLVLQFVPSGLILSWILLGAHVIALHRSRVYQAIHDRIAGTWVAALRKPPSFT